MRRGLPEFAVAAAVAGVYLWACCSVVVREGLSAGPLDRLLPSVADAEERAALGTVRGWLRAAEASPDSILVGFFR